MNVEGTITLTLEEYRVLLMYKLSFLLCGPAENPYQVTFWIEYNL